MCSSDLAIFGPLFSELTRQLLDSVDSSRFLFFTRKAPAQIEDFFGDLDSHVPMDVLELDISRYDKSQNEFHCAVEYEIWRRLGFEDFLGEVWKQGSIGALQTFVNTQLGEEWEADRSEVADIDFDSRLEDYELHDLPDNNGTLILNNYNGLLKSSTINFYKVL